MKKKIIKDLIGNLSQFITTIKNYCVWQRYGSFEPQLITIQRRRIT